MPFGFGVVELPADGLHVITLLTETDPDRLAAGDPMSFTTVPVSDDVLVVGLRAGGIVTGSGVQIAGTGIYPFGRHGDLSATAMGALAVRQALDEAGPDTTFQAAFCGTAYGGVAAGHRVLGELGLTGGPIIDIEAGCASGAAALSMAAAAIRAGQYDTVLVFGIEKMPKGIIRSSFFDPWREQAGLAATPAYFALRAQRLMIDSGITKEQLAAVVVKNRGQGVHNENAMFRKAVTVDDVLASKLVCEPLHLFMLCSPNEGAAAVVLRAGERSACSCGPPPCAATCRATCSTRARRCPVSSTATRRRRRRWLRQTPTPPPGSVPRTSTWPSARTPMPPVSCSPTSSSACALPRTSGAWSTRARRPWAGASR